MPQTTAPHFLLLTQTHSTADSADRGGTWRFVLEEMGSSERIEVTEHEPGLWGERLQLLAVVRGLEALEQPSRVTLITPSRFVGNGIRRGISLWKENGWQWENFDQMSSIKNCDLWRRVDQAMQFHQITCRIWDFGTPEPERVRSSTRNRISFGEIQTARQLSYSASSTTSNELADRVKPVGQGRAFGYVPN
jgi:ribonuclease HI